MHSYIKSLILAALCCALAPAFTQADEASEDPFKPFPDQLAPSLFNEVEDKYEFGIRAEEKALYYYVLKHLRETSLQDQKQAAQFNLQQRRSELKTFKEHPKLKLPLFPDIFKNSNRYKGRLVTLTGRVRKLIHYPAEKNEYGIKTLYEAWLFTDDSQQNPTVVVCTDVPPELKDGLPKGTDVIDHVTVTGYLFKMYVYNAQDATRVAPLILAGQLEWTPQVVDEKGSLLFSQILAGTLIILIAGVAFAMWKASQKDKQFREARLKTSEEQVSFNQLESPPAATQVEPKLAAESKSEPKTESKSESKSDDKTPE
ncbi:hypothetical protein [Gimesia fumaroli]|uniref:SURF1-like protein n=1 Tax=Gimesia fumaroli TaxID=2527976 RepID=A0A518IIT7_9PLAN|nr:hypothetical protein [Gimesia fumaroli]QDV53009.1 hypothetical protein Enr17x_50790 [Gimesia fumaroli]